MPNLIARLGRIARMDVRILLTFLVIAPSLLAFAKLASEVVEGDTMAFDRQIMLALRTPENLAVPVGPEWLHISMVDFTAMGGAPVLTLVTLLSAGYLLARRKWALALLLAASIGLGAILNALLKNGFVRERPDVVPHLVEVASASFPSGHAMSSATVYLTLAALLASAERAWRVRIFIMTAAVLLTFLVGASRVYLGVHWPTDVLAGWSVGAAWAVAALIVARALQARDAVEGPGPEPSDGT